MGRAGYKRIFMFLFLSFTKSSFFFIFRAKKNTWTKRIETIESQPPQLEQEKARLPNPS
jgi:hypothetical protein